MTQIWTSFGQAGSESERALEAILARVPAWRGKALRYRPVPGGISNTNWRIGIPGEADCFLKVPGRGTEMFIARDAANDASRRAQSCGFGVPVIDYLPDEGVEIFAFAEGFRASSNLDFLRPAVRGNAVRALRAFNDSAPLGLTKTIFDMIEEHVAQVAQVGGRLPPDQGHLMRAFAEAKAALTASGLDLVPCMNDTLAGNFLIDDDDRVLLVDFEYASNNERTYELALWFDEMAFPQAVEDEMIEAYFGRWDRRIAARIAVLKALGDLKWATWAMIQEAVSTLDFDYYKYGSWKHQRARTLFHHPDWPLWLRQV
ncbi:choline kinase family protein [Methylobacterium indicum]|uniref:Choline kinase n=1 Tax=Methylobacterium indicum TaxID=1775910 RepID=A0A0J6R6A2_9HYPH|nr:choline kinase family protein [Methylobacterium indicum]KMO16927.1 choline kinase [Methylobacterium indicum]KMO26848.1 choline kinase [Methylobacterium indicum]BCM87174.1 choline kinase [Methylobacterium indicum]